MLSQYKRISKYCNSCVFSFAGKIKNNSRACLTCSLHATDVNTEVNYYMKSGFPVSKENRSFVKLLRSKKIVSSSSKYYENVVFKQSYLEILGICARLKLPGKLPEEAFQVLKLIWKKLKPGTAERNYKNLVPVIIFRTAKMHGISVDLKSLFSEINCSPRKFRTVLASTYGMLPNLNKKKHIVNKIVVVCDNLNVPSVVKLRAIKIFAANSSVLMGTTVNVSVGASITMGVLASGSRKNYPAFKIGKAANCSSSAIMSRIIKVLYARKIRNIYKMNRLDSIIPVYYKYLTKTPLKFIIKNKFTIRNKKKLPSVHINYGQKNDDSCNICNTKNFTTNPEGFTICKTCGTQQEGIPFMNDPHHNPNLSHAIFAPTTKTVIGNKNERINRFKRLSKVHDFSTNDYETSITKYAFIEIQRICSALQLPELFQKAVMTMFKKTWKHLDSGKAERNYEILVPVIIYREAKAMEIAVNFKSIFAEMRCTPKKFKSCLISTYKLFPTINHERHILKRIDRLCNELKMDHDTKTRALKIFQTNKSVLMATTSNVCVGSSLSIAVISLGLRSEFPIFRIARKIKSSSSAISSRIQRVLKSHRIPSAYKAKQLDSIIPEYYKILTEEPIKR